MAAKGFLYYTVSNHSHSVDKNCIKGIWYVCDSASVELLLISLLLKQFYNIRVAERAKPSIFTCWDTEMYLLGMLSMVEAVVANPAVPGEVCYRLRYNSGFFSSGYDFTLSRFLTLQILFVCSNVDLNFAHCYCGLLLSLIDSVVFVFWTIQNIQCDTRQLLSVHERKLQVNDLR